MKSALCIVLFIFGVQSGIFAQGENNNWYFGDSAGISFSTGFPAALTNGKLATVEGCATVSDSLGNLLFYTNGITVWNKDHQIMVNGTGLLGHESSTNSALIVKQPGYRSRYFVFTTDAEGGPAGLNYSLLDLATNNGSGSVIQKNIHLRNSVTERLTWTRHQNDTMIWVVGHDWSSDVFYSYRVSSKGVNTTPSISPIGVLHAGVDAIGNIAISPDGTSLALPHRTNQIFQLFRFNKANGKVSNVQTLLTGQLGGPLYSVEFSADGSILYGTRAYQPSMIYQYNIKAGNINQINASRINIPASNVLFLGALQRGPDNKIYVARFPDAYVGVIHQPDLAGAACQYVDDGFFLNGRLCEIGLPLSTATDKRTNLQMTAHSVCLGDSNEFNVFPITSGTVTWKFSDPSSGAANTAYGYQVKHLFSNPGIYNVSATVTENGLSVILKKQVTVNVLPVFSLGPDTAYCDTALVRLSIPDPDSTLRFLWSTSSTKPSIRVQETGTYWLQLTNKAGCTFTDSVFLTFNDCSPPPAFLIPNVITPNQDGFNDAFVVQGLTGHVLRLQVFNRWGAPVSVQADYLNDWNAEGLPEGIYYYLLEDTSTSKSYKGYVEVLH